MIEQSILKEKEKYQTAIEKLEEECRDLPENIEQHKKSNMVSE